ncbi:uncharacterized protein LOC110449376 [Mizuhopecten yessoensis]|uniref:Uncharacterized protein n=1 Tax=Mizuhopecten yessoensis TaxID=6573 RepID=A0A210QRG4_MIZYE|nr:uncharacterized protein LOC110449376 [Mizuhopecten yessoensis]OWF51278.1 hypothetical protein KP79_PYT24252 [Mizuhopecten yessoensis]
MASNDGEIDAEQALQELLEKNAESIETMTLRIVFCNPIGGDPFSAAVVTTQENLSALYNYPSQRTNLFKFKHVWDVEKLHKLINTKRRQDSDQDNCPKRIKLEHECEAAAFRLLEAYLKDFAYHHKCLEKVLFGSNDVMESSASATMVLNTHLFGPLSDGNCIVDNHMSRQEHCTCSCGCGKEIKSGNTGIGVSSTWHGFVDMIVKEHLPVTISDMEEPSMDEDTTEEQDEGQEEMEKDTNTFCVHDKQKSVTSRLIAETITNAFAQVNTNDSLAGLPIPTFGCAPRQISVYLYDCKNDVLLKKTLPLHLFKRKDSASAVVMLWLYMNFQLFMKRDVTDIEAHSDLSDFQAQFCSSDANIQEIYAKVKSGFTGCAHPDQPSLTSVVRTDEAFVV